MIPIEFIYKNQSYTTREVAPSSYRIYDTTHVLGGYIYRTSCYGVEKWRVAGDRRMIYPTMLEACQAIIDEATRELLT